MSKNNHSCLVIYESEESQSFVDSYAFCSHYEVNHRGLPSDVMAIVTIENGQFKDTMFRGELEELVEEYVKELKDQDINQHRTY